MEKQSSGIHSGIGVIFFNLKYSFVANFVILDLFILDLVILVIS